MPVLDGLQPVLDSLSLGKIEQKAIGLLLREPDGLSKNMAEVLSPGKKSKEVQCARDILFNVLAGLIAAGKDNNHYFTLLEEPTKILHSFLFGAVNWRSPVNPSDREVKIDCCFQFEFNGEPTYISFYAMTIVGSPPCSLDDLGCHLNALISFACLCLHALLFPEEATPAFQLVLSIEDVKAEVTDDSLSLRQRIFEFLFTRLLTLHYHLQNDTSLSPAGAMHVVMTSLELLTKLHVSDGPSNFSPVYSEVLMRQSAEKFFQSLVDQALVEVRAEQNHGEGEPILGKYMHQSKPSLSLRALQQAISREQKDKVVPHPILTAMLSERKMLANLDLTVAIADLYLWIHNWLAQVYFEEDVVHTPLNQAVDDFIALSLDSEEPSVRQRAENAEQILRRGRLALNEFHSRTDGLTARSVS